MKKPLTSFRKRMSEKSPEEQLEIQIGGTLLLGEVLKELREGEDLTQSDIGKLLKMPQSNISKLEGQEDFKVSTFQKYLGALGYRISIVPLSEQKAVTA